MSRSAKSRAEKSRGGGSAGVPVPPTPLQEPVVTSDIIAGSLTESSWREMVEREEGEEAVGGLIDELMCRVMDRCYELHLQTQLVPFCVWWAREALVQTVGRRFLVRDEGDGAPLWTEDTEPEPSVTDSWAEGCVPTVYVTRPAHTPLLQKLLDHNVEEPEDPSRSQGRDGAHPPASEQLPPAKLDSRNMKPSRTHKQTPTLSPSKSTAAQLQPRRAPLPAPRTQKPLPVCPPAALRPLQENEDLSSVKNAVSKKRSDLQVLKRRPVRLAQKLN